MPCVLMKGTPKGTNTMDMRINIQHGGRQRPAAASLGLGPAELMANDDTKEVYPAPMKPFKGSSTEGELDELWKGSLEQDKTVTMIIPKGSTRRRAMCIVHHGMTLLHKEILVESSTAKMEALQVASRKETFKKSIEAAMEEFYGERDKTPLGLDKPDRQKPQPAWVMAKVDAMYAEVVEKAEQDKSEEDKRAEEEAKDKEEAQRRLFASKPELALAHFVDDRIAGKAVTDDSQDVDMDAAETKERVKAELVVEALRGSSSSKNGSSDVGGNRSAKNGRKWSSPTGPTSRKSEQFGKSKGKGKGKGKQDWKTNGKGYSSQMPQQIWRGSWGIKGSAGKKGKGKKGGKGAKSGKKNGGK